MTTTFKLPSFFLAVVLSAPVGAQAQSQADAYILAYSPGKIIPAGRRVSKTFDDQSSAQDVIVHEVKDVADRPTSCAVSFEQKEKRPSPVVTKLNLSGRTRLTFVPRPEPACVCK